MDPNDFFRDKFVAPPPEYEGPNIEDLREMGKSSVLYISYLPALVFWRLFWATYFVSCALVTFLWLGCFVCAPDENNLQAREKVWMVFRGGFFTCTIYTMHHYLRLFAEKCLLRAPEEDEEGGTGRLKFVWKIRCLCFFSWCQVLGCIVALAMGPFVALSDYLKGIMSSIIFAIEMHKPMFTQAGELCDYVYCCYCAALYFEKVAHHQEHLLRTKDSESIFEVHLDVKEILQEPGYRAAPWGFGFCAILFLMPYVAYIVLNCMTTALGMECHKVEFGEGSGSVLWDIGCLVNGSLVLPLFR